MLVTVLTVEKPFRAQCTAGLLVLALAWLVAGAAAAQSSNIWDAQVYHRCAPSCQRLDQSSRTSADLGEIPVLFVHGHKTMNLSCTRDSDDHYKTTWIDRSGDSSFHDALSLAANNDLDVEPYYLHFDNTKQDRSILQDAIEVGKAIEQILQFHDSTYSPGQSTTNVQVVVIAYSKGTISTRLYLKGLAGGVPGLAPRPDFRPVSEFIAIAPPNHGLNYDPKAQCNLPLPIKQLMNGYDGSGNSFDPNRIVKPCAQFDYDLDLNLIDCLNGHPTTDTIRQLGSYPTEAPRSSDGCGLLYVTLYASGNGDVVGGNSPSNDPLGRKLARNLAPHAVNVEVAGIPGGNELIIHKNTVHDFDVICKALYTAAYHRAPPRNLPCKKGSNGAPIIPDRQPGVALLFDTSGSMTWAPDGTIDVPEQQQRRTLAADAAEVFVTLLDQHSSAQIGVAAFPRQPRQGCTGEVLSSLAPASGATVPALDAGGSTPLLAGLETAEGMFTDQTHRAVVLLTDGEHNCPRTAEIGSQDLTDRIEQLQEERARVFTVGFGRDKDVDSSILDEIAGRTCGEFFPVTRDQGFDPAQPEAWNPATALQGAYTKLLQKALDLEAGVDPVGFIGARGRITHPVRLNLLDRRVSFILSWAGGQRLGLTVKSSDGEPVPATEGYGVSLAEGDAFTILTVRQQFLKLPGKVSDKPWQIIVAGGESAAHYHYGVLMDSDLRMRAALDRPSYRTGEPMVISARITAAGQAVTGLEEVRATVTAPEDGAGNWLAGNPVPAAALDRVAAARGAEASSLRLRKSIALADELKQSFPGRTLPREVLLNDRGEGADARAGDGIYSGRFTATNREGTYAVQLAAGGTTAAGHAFDRHAVFERYVTVGPTAEETAITVTDLGATREAQRFEIVVVPKDALGNFLGPGWGATLRLTTSQGWVPEEPEDHLDGSYSWPLTLSPEVDARDLDVALSLRGANVAFQLGDELRAPLSLGFHVGTSLPRGSFGSLYDPGPALGLDLGYAWRSQLAVVGVLGFHRFRAQSPAAGDENLWRAGVKLRYAFGEGTLTPWVEAGPGVYVPEHGSTRPGLEVGAGLAYRRASGRILEVGAAYHRILTSGGGRTFLALYGGLRFQL